MLDRKTTTRLPRIACEITEKGVAVARAHASGEIVAHSHALAAGVVTPALNAQNVHNPEALRAVIAEELTSVGGQGQVVVAVLPDSAIRTTILDFESLPSRLQEAESTVRFRLRKSLPFDIEKAAVSFDSQATPHGLRVVASIVLHSVLEEYESAFRAAGCSPGVVLPSSLGALGALDGDRPTMLLKIAPDATSVSVVDDGQLLLFRILEGPGIGPVTAERIAEDIYPSLVFFQDTYGSSLDLLLVSGVPNLDGLAASLKAQAGVNVRELIDSSMAAGNIRHEFAGAIGALL